MTILASKLSTQLSNKSILPPFKRCSLNKKEDNYLEKRAYLKRLNYLITFMNSAKLSTVVIL
jgi:hypothetical protein